MLGLEQPIFNYQTDVPVREKLQFFSFKVLYKVICIKHTIMKNATYSVFLLPYEQ